MSDAAFELLDANIKRYNKEFKYSPSREKYCGRRMVREDNVVLSYMNYHEEKDYKHEWEIGKFQADVLEELYFLEEFFYYWLDAELL